MFGSLMVFVSSVVFYLALLVTKDLPSLVFYSLAYAVSIIGNTCFSLAIVPFLTDQLLVPLQMSSVQLCSGTHGRTDLVKFYHE